jgi:tetratricopeptide (TPR) repeat protein
MKGRALQNAAENLRADRRTEEACRQVPADEPSRAEALHQLAILAFESGRMEEAADLFARAAKAQPARADYWCNQGLAQARLGHHAAAIACYRKALELAPDLFEANLNLAAALMAENEMEAAIKLYRQVIDHRPETRQAHINLGLALYWTGRICESKEVLARGLERWQDDSLLRWALAHAYLAEGNLPEGWKQLEYRWVNRDPELQRHNCPEPMWRGEDLRGRRILLHTEGGFGDTIQMARYAPLVADLGADVIVAAPPTMAELLRSLRGVTVVSSDRTQDIPQFDYHCPMLSLPGVMGTTLKNVPASVPYLRPDPPRREKWKRRMAGEPKGKKVGLVWGGDATNPTDSMRSIPLEMLAPLAGTADARFYSVQKGRTDPSPAGFPLTDWTADLSDWSETAALVSQLDLVISVDTAPAHLAGALGKPVWLLLPPVLYWRWMRDRNDSPWYPTMRIFRQKHRGDWTAAVQDAAAALREL